MRAYRLLRPAEEEMLEAARYYETAQAGLGEAFLDDIQHAIDAARERSTVGSIVSNGLRRVLVRRFPFGVIYATDLEEILVIAVAHQRRRPGYWKSRL